MYTTQEISLVPIALVLFLTLVPTSSQSFYIANSFGFIQNLEGSKKGEMVEGLNMLKCYLGYFGYLNHPHQSYCVDDPLDEHNIFDESLEDAIKTYQLNYGLRATGYLDEYTAKQMMKPRCGLPDIINGTNTMLPRRDLARQNYEIIGKWAKTSLTYKFVPNKDTPHGLDAKTVLSLSLGEWAKHSHFKFRQVPLNVKSDIEARFGRWEHGDGAPFDGPGGILAHAGGPPDGGSHYDADEHWVWTTHPQDGAVDLQAVMTHELGHTLGLGHSADLNAVMYPSYDPNHVKRTLGKDDIDGIHAIYGN